MKHAKLLFGAIESMGLEVETAGEYAEPGYDGEDIFFANWNPRCGYDAPKAEQKRDAHVRLAEIVERLGGQVEWHDEWTTCSECGRAVRTQPDCYSWTSFYRIINEGDLVCLDCLRENTVEYLESIENNSTTCCPPEIDPEEHGYVKYNGEFETGFHPGQNDRPENILKEMKTKGLKHVIFRMDCVGQFDARWEAYYKDE